jgi:immunity protein 17 of polymorphic toxin system
MRGALRCSCNYVFAYEPAPRTAHVAGRPGLTLMLFAVAAGAMVLGHTWLRSQPGLERHGDLGFLLVPAGAFSIAGAVLDWSWFFAARKARLITSILGRGGARIFYAAIGGALVGAGLGLG